MYSYREVKAYAETAEVKRLLATVETSLVSAKEGATIAVSSAQRGEGKSLTALSLAISALMTHRNHRVLLMDMNWYAPTVNGYFDLSLEDEYTNGGEIPQLSHMTYSTRIKGLDVLIPSSNVIKHSFACDSTHDFFSQLLEQARQSYSLVIADTRSLFPSNREIRVDPVKICSTVDAVVFVTMAGVTPRQEVKRAIKILETAGADKIGVALNQFKNTYH